MWHLGDSKQEQVLEVCRFHAREEIAYRYPIMYEIIRKIFSPEACVMFMSDNEADDKL